MLSFRNMLKHPFVKLIITVVLALILGVAIAFATIGEPKQANETLSATEYCYESTDPVVGYFKGTPKDQGLLWFSLHNCGTKEWVGDVELEIESSELITPFFWSREPSTTLTDENQAGVFMELAIEQHAEPGFYDTTFRLVKDGKSFGDPVVITIEVTE